MLQYNPYDSVKALEEKIAEYGGSKYAVAVDSCTNALLIALRYSRLVGECDPIVELPCRTYVGVAYAVLNAGLKIKFRAYKWQGAYRLEGTNIIDSARRFTKNMYVANTLYCVSGHWSKTLKIGRAGFILTDDSEAARILRIMRFDGRSAGVPPVKDNFIYPGYHCYLLPEEASRGLMLMASMPDHNDDIEWDAYADLSKFPIFTEAN